jgi:hypothetical protein
MIAVHLADDDAETREQLLKWLAELKIKPAAATPLVETIIAYMDRIGHDEFDDFIDELASSSELDEFARNQGHKSLEDVLGENGVKPAHFKKMKTGALKIRDSRARSSTRSRAWSAAPAPALAPVPAPAAGGLAPVQEESSAPPPAPAAAASKPVVNGYVFDVTGKETSSGNSYVVTATHELTEEKVKVKVLSGDNRAGYDHEVGYLKKVKPN